MDQQPPERPQGESGPESQAFAPPAGRSANAAGRYLLFGVAFFFVAGLWAWWGFANSDYLTGARTPVEQPIIFSHRHHAGDLGIDCRYCHTHVEDSSFAGIPSTETCMTCHSQLFTDSPMLEPVRESFATGESIPWIRVHDLPEFVYFDHSIHIQKGVSCIQCHGDVADMPLISQQETLHMDWCLDCHRDHEPTIPPDHPGLGEQAIYERGATPNLSQRNPINPLTNCYTCHR